MQPEAYTTKIGMMNIHDVILTDATEFDNTYMTEILCLITETD
jgi:hypothetical protein